MKNIKKPHNPSKMDASIEAEAMAKKWTNQEKTTKKLPAAVELGRLGGLKGGKARALKLSAERRKEIAKEAARKRWEKS